MALQYTTKKIIERLTANSQRLPFAECNKRSPIAPFVNNGRKSMANKYCRTNASIGVAGIINSGDLRRYFFIKLMWSRFQGIEIFMSNVTAKVYIQFKVNSLGNLLNIRAPKIKMEKRIILT